MTIASEANRSGPYACNGTTTRFPYAFKIYDAAHIRVILTAPDGSERLLALGTDYTVSGTGEEDGGAVETLAAPAVGYQVTLILNVPFTQEIDLENQGAYFAETIERAIDLQTQMSLQLKEQVARAVVLPATSSVSVDTLTGAVLSLSEIQPQMETLAPITEEIRTVAGISGAVVAAEGNAETASVAAGVATSKAAEAAASAAAAKTWEPASYSTTGEIETMLGGYVPVGRKLIAGSAGVKLNGGTEASLAGDVTIAVAGVPTGAVMGFDLTSPPDGWIVGDGAAINRHAYADLDAVKYCGDALNATATAWYRCTDPASPGGSRSVSGDYLVTRDLRGVFPRYLDGGRGIDSGRELGSQQGDALQGHRHLLTPDGLLLRLLYQSSGVYPGSGAALAITNPITTSGDPVSDESHGTPRIASETRPVNIALLGCIKY